MESIIEKYLEGKATEKEMKELLIWLRNNENRAFFHRVSLVWRDKVISNSFTSESRDSWMLIQEKIADKNNNSLNRVLKINHILKYAAIFLFVITLSVIASYLIINRSNVSYETFSTIYADNGHLSKVELPDGSMVWLNSGSKVIYNNKFALNNRRITLEGEAFFDVKKGKDLPFLVNCNDITVKVHGTRFNVITKDDETKVDVVLEEGEVELLKNEDESSIYILQPGELASFDRQNRKLSINQVNTTRYTSWKEGILNIYNQPLKEVIKMLEDRYNQKFEYENEIAGILYTFTIKNESLGDILNLMESITPVKAVQKGNVIQIKTDKMKRKNIR